jgi:superfamily II DNA or RNA helicase
MNTYPDIIPKSSSEITRIRIPKSSIPKPVSNIQVPPLPEITRIRIPKSSIPRPVSNIQAPPINTKQVQKKHREDEDEEEEEHDEEEHDEEEHDEEEHDEEEHDEEEEEDEEEEHDEEEHDEEEQEEEHEEEHEEDINTTLNNVEKREHLDNAVISNDSEFDFLYPHINDPNFSHKIAMRREFFETQYDGDIHDIKKQSDIVCKAEFELMPHQLFIKNFLSFNTPYNSLFLYHELGTGKTCSAIGVAEEMRGYLKNIGMKQKIIIVANPNVQDNFRSQLFNEKLLENTGGTWNIRSCVGKTLLNEINPTSIKDFKREKIISKINGIIAKHYSFKGYIEFANDIRKVSDMDENLPKEDQLKFKIQTLKREFSNRLIIIDEVHNIRSVDYTKYKKTVSHLTDIVKHADNLRLLLLSATPMYNSYKEIIWIVNLMNINDRRSQIKISDVFDKDGFFKEASSIDEEGGEALLRRKLIGYMSYVRGENPYSFPYRIYPHLFSPENTFSNPDIIRPTIQFDGSVIEDPLNAINVFNVKIGTYQEVGYSAIMNSIIRSPESHQSMDVMDTMGRKLLLDPTQALNMVYPDPELDEMISNNTDILGADVDTRTFIQNITGKRGLNNIMTHVDDSFKNPPEIFHFEYKPETLSKYGRIFHKDNISKYSNKIATICECIRKSGGVILIYSAFIDSGVIPMALALEEMGFSRFSSVPRKPLLKKNTTTPIELIDARTMLPHSSAPHIEDFIPANYAMITGNKSFSPNNNEDMKRIVDNNNKNGNMVKVVIISRAGAEGLDFKAVRQIHIMDAWYNMSRTQQIIGRGVRNLSHCSLPFNERNTEIYLYSTLLNKNPEKECIDLYIYRLSEKKAVQIGRVTRILKEASVDCILNIKQTNFTVEKLNELAVNQNIQMLLSSGKKINYMIGDKPFSDTCDYMEKCEFKCSPDIAVSSTDVVSHTYNVDFIKMNNDIIVQKIRNMFKDKHFYIRHDFINIINITKQYPIEQIYFAITYLIDNNNEYLVDKYGRLGNLINSGDYYLFQPSEITDQNATIYERTNPVDYKRSRIFMALPNENITSQTDATIVDRESTETDENIYETYNQLITNFDVTLSAATNPDQPFESQSKWTWYMHASRVIAHMENVHRFSLEMSRSYIIYHIIDTLELKKKLILLKVMFDPEWISKNELEDIIKEYFVGSIMNVENRQGMLMTDQQNNIILYVKKQESVNDWDEAQPTDYEINTSDLPNINFGNKIKGMITHTENIARYLGFFSCFKKKEIIFKIKDMSQTGNKQYKGSRVDQSGKDPVIKLLNDIQQVAKYTRENTNTISQIGLCVILEFIMRHMTDTSDSKIMFLTQEKAYLIRSLIQI